jgi:adenine-specific DNA-methyltransferase
MDDLTDLESLTVEQLIEVIREKTGAGVNLSFPGKVLARQIGRRVRPRTMRTVKGLSFGDEEGRARNLVIEGDNLQALASLYRERGQIDMILTDPPYNTGSDFRYNDKWDTDPNDPAMGDLVGSDDPARHTKWMKFMYPRLQMMRSMLKPSGVLAICIDSRELFHLGQMLDELFDEENRLAIINWEKTAAPRSDKNHVTATTEYVLVYAKNIKAAMTAALQRSDADNRRYGSPDEDLGGPWREGNLTARTWAKKDDYAIQSPFTGATHYPAGEGAWRHPKRNIKKWLEEWGSAYHEVQFDDGRVKALMLAGGFSPAAADRARARLAQSQWPFIWFGREGEGRPRTKTYLEQIKRGKVPVTYWADDALEFPIELGSVSWDYSESGRSSDGAAELTAIVGQGHGFTTVKPLKLFIKLLQLWAPNEGIVLDPFAGSGTTGHAVMAANVVTGGARRFIMVEQGRPERGDSYARDLTADRLRRAVSGNWASGEGVALDSGFTFKTLEKKVDAQTLLLMERDEMIDTVIGSHSSTGSRRAAVLIPLLDGDEPYKYLVAKNAANEGIFLVWAGAGSNPDLTEEVYESITEEAEKVGLAETYHVYSRRNLFATDDVVWYQIPDRILSDFGLDIRTESYTEEG